MKPRISMQMLYQLNCQAISNGTSLNAESDSVKQHLEQVPNWSIKNCSIYRCFDFSNYQETVAFVNAVANIAIEQDHHPDIQFSYKQCFISYSTHSVGGLSLNDFICAAKIDRLVKQLK